MEVLMRIPFAIKPPKGGVRGKVETSLISAIDIAATCLTVAGADVPEHMASRDLSHYWSHAEDLVPCDPTGMSYTWKHRVFGVCAPDAGK